ncbi:hypothetical protein BJ741DRAFT_592495 [Chytriomyces cf. hyalinus JEL632]|nr:hypothetical protein BJ741DRAFT_592495 [Chytriomyces cf. hyalinus JEL632]
MESAHGQHSGQGDGTRYPLYGTGVGVSVGVGVGGAGLSVDTAAHTHSQNHPSTQTQPQSLPQSLPPAHLHPHTHSQQSPLDRPVQHQQHQHQQQANSTGSNTLNLINLIGNTANMQMASMSGILSQHNHPNPYSMQYSASTSQSIAFPSDLIHQQTQPQPRQSLHLQPLQKHSLQDVSSFSPVEQTSSVTSFESPTTANPIIAPAADGGSEAGSPTEGNLMADMSDSCLFRRSVQKCHIWNADKSKSYDIEVKPLIDRGFFMTEGNWTCYRRNYFQLSSSFSITESATDDSTNYASISGHGNSAPSSTAAAPTIDTSATPLPTSSKYFLEIKERLVPITNFLTHMSAYASSSTDGSSAPQGPVELVQHTSKRDKGELTQPVPRVTDKDQRITFERIQFRTATSNNGRRRMGDQQQPLSAGSNGTSVSGGPLAQQFFIVVVEVLCKVASGEFYKVCESEMDRGVVVRGRAPGHYVARDQGSMGVDSRKLSSAGGTPRLSAKRSVKGVDAAVTKVEQHQQQQQQLDTGYVNFGSMVNQQNTPRATAQQQIPTGLYQQQQQQRPNQYQSQPQTPASMPLPSPISRPPTIPELMVAQERERAAAHAKQNTSQMYTSFYGNGGGMQQTPQQQRPVLQQQQLQQLHPYATASQHTQQQLQHLQQPHQQQQQQYPSFMQQHQPHQQTQSQIQQPQLQQPQQQQQPYPYQQQHRPGPAPQQQTHSSAMNLGFGFPSQPQTAQHAYPLLPQQPPLQHQHHQQTQQQQQQQLYPSAQYSQYSPGYSQMQLQLQYQQQQQRNQVAQFQQQHMRQQQQADQMHAQNQAAAAIAEVKAHNSTTVKATLKEADFDEESEEFEEPDDSDDDYKPRGSRGGSRGGRGGGRLKR